MSSVCLARKNGRIDRHLEIQYENERSYWRKVLQRVVAVDEFLSQRGLVVGTMRFMDLTTMETFWGLLSCWHNSIRSSQIMCLVIAVQEEAMFLIFHPQSAMNLLS